MSQNIHSTTSSEVIYVANPYTGTSYERNQRFLAVEKYTADLIREGKTVVSPIVHNHVLAFRHELPHDFKFWQNYCQTLLAVCNKMHILTLSGWEDSVGVQGEIKIALEMEMPIMCADPKTYEHSVYLLAECCATEYDVDMDKEREREIYDEMDGSAAFDASVEELY